MLWNLLANAVKFTPEGGTVHLRASRKGAFVEFVVTDSGIGIARDFLPAVFEPFRQADGSPTREHDGLGLGLAIVKQLVQAHDGTIEVDSAGEGCGSTFTVRLPYPGQRPGHAGDMVPKTAVANMTVAQREFTSAVTTRSISRV